MSTLYREELLDHFRYPRNRGTLSAANGSSEVLNPSCGDEIAMYIKIADTRLSDIAFTGKGCVISQAAASLLTQKVNGLTLDEIEALTKNDMLSLVGISLGPTRLRCALLALESLHKAIAHYRGSHA